MSDQASQSGNVSVPQVLPAIRTNFDYQALGDDGYIAAKAWNECLKACTSIVIRLQADVERLTSEKSDAVAIVDESDDGLFIDILYGENGSSLRRGDKLYTSPPDRGYMSRLAYEALQSDLTKARELLAMSVDVWADGGNQRYPSLSNVNSQIRTFLTHQSAPAAKPTPEELAEDEEDRKKVFVRSNTHQGENISLDEMITRYAPDAKGDL